MSRLLRRPGHLLRRQHEGGGADLPADLHRHLFEGGLRQALRAQDADHRGRSPERSRGAVLRRAGGEALPDADRSRHGISAAIPSATNTSSTWRSRTSTIPARRPRARRPTASSSASTRPCWTSSTGWRSARRSTGTSPSCRPISTPGSGLQRRARASGALVLRQDADADLP